MLDHDGGAHTCSGEVPGLFDQIYSLGVPELDQHGVMTVFRTMRKDRSTKILVTRHVTSYNDAMNIMKNPPHPGEIIKKVCIEPLGLTITQAAQGLGVTRKTLSQVLNGHAGISPEIAIRLSKAFGRSPESWLALQSAYDLAQIVEEAAKIDVKPLFENRMSI